jgi:hypothetical protein
MIIDLSAFDILFLSANTTGLPVDEAEKKNSPKAEPEDTTDFARGSSLSLV